VDEASWRPSTAAGGTASSTDTRPRGAQKARPHGAARLAVVLLWGSRALVTPRASAGSGVHRTPLRVQHSVTLIITAIAVGESASDVSRIWRVLLSRTLRHSAVRHPQSSEWINLTGHRGAHGWLMPSPTERKTTSLRWVLLGVLLGTHGAVRASLDLPLRLWCGAPCSLAKDRGQR